MKIKFLIIFLFLIFLTLVSPLLAQETPLSLKQEVLEGKIVKILKEEMTIQAGQKTLNQELAILITKGSLKDKEVKIETGTIPLVGQPRYQVGDKVLLNYSYDPQGNEVFNILDFMRTDSMVWLFFIFVFLVVAIGKWWGVSSLLGLGISFLTILKFILPNIYAGHDPVLIAILGSLFIIPTTFYLSHGLNRKTTTAVFSTLIALLITGLLAKFFVDFAKLTGYASEQASFLQVTKEGIMNIKGLLLAGIIIGTLGVLDDITVSQAAVVQQLKDANPKISRTELFSRAMRVGQDHIASMVNTLVLVYTGAALPLLLLFIDNSQPFSQVINYEIITEEIIRTLVGSIGLISAVPLTTFFATYLRKDK